MKKPPQELIDAFFKWYPSNLDSKILSGFSFFGKHGTTVIG
jgi:hypothetical protein